ncbi:MAG: M3 family oligoendopeptidase [Lachnospiraceae bacterium]|nr:M3 family oligoendopeptidase [Lachnospiraceae bacterium]
MKFSEMPYSRADLDEAVQEGRRLAERAMEAQSGREQLQIHQEFNRLLGHVRTLRLIASIRRDGDMTDLFYEKENEYYDREMPRFQAVQTEYQKAVCKAPFREYLEKEIGQVPFASMELAAKAFDEKLIPLIQEENKLVARYSKLIASAAIEWEGEILNLSLLGKYMRSADRQVRQAAWGKYASFFTEHGEELDEIYDRLVANRTRQAKLLGYENYIEMGYYLRNRNSYGREQVEELRQQVKKVYVPFAERMHERRRKRLGVEHLYYYDEGVYFPEGNPAPAGTPEEILAAGEQMYTELSKETAGFFRMMRKMELFDVLGRKNKKAGGYMEELPDYKVPFIYANFNGTSGDLDVITHECGHAFQYYVAAEDPVMDHYSYLSMETAEIHSMSMEFFTEPWMNLFFGERGGDYRSMHLEDAVAFVPYGCMVDEFQHIVYGNPEMTPQQRREAWKELEQEYRPHMDPTGCAFLENGGFWQKQLHIFEIPFYYIDYVIAQLCAFQYKIKMDRDYPAAWDSYLKLCRLSGSRFYPELMEAAGLRVPFETGCIGEIVAELEKKL